MRMGASLGRPEKSPLAGDADVSIRATTMKGFAPPDQGVLVLETSPLHFRRSLRGYDPGDVDEAFAALHEKVESLTARLAERERELQRVSRDLDEATTKSDRGRASFAELGTEFESTLRMAEQQARQIREDAAAEATETLNAARAEASRARDTAMRETQSLLVESQRRAESLVLEAERESTTLRQEAAELSQKAKNARSRGERAAANAEAAGRNRAEEIIAEARREAEQIKQAAEQARHETQELIITMEAELRQKEAEAEAERAVMYEKAQAYQDKAYSMADAHVAEASKRAAALAAEADQTLASAHATANDVFFEARSRGEAAANRAMARAHAITEETEKLVEFMYREAELQMAEARHRQSLLNRYVGDVRTIMSSEELRIIATRSSEPEPVSAAESKSDETPSLSR